MAKHEFTVTVDGNIRNLKIININPEMKMESQKWYARALNEALKNEVPLRIEMEKILENRGVLDTTNDERKAVQIRKNIKDLEIQLRQGIKDGRKMTKEEGRKLALQIKSERMKLREVGDSLANILGNTAESYASNEQNQFFLYACTVDAHTGQRYWPSFEVFKTDTDSEVYAEAAKEFLSMITGVDKDYERKMYENAWLIKMGFMNQDLQLIDSKGRLVDEEGRLINKEGRYINENEEYVDIYGNRIDDDGNLLVTDTWGVIADKETESTV